MRSRPLVLGILLMLLLAYAGITDPSFLTLRAQSLLAPHIWELAIVTIPMFLIILSGGIDLSVGSTVALAGVGLGLLVERGVNPFPAALFAVLLGTSLGAMNGLCIARLKVHPLIVTLATLAAYRGIAEGISSARPLSGYGEGFLAIASGPMPLLVFVVLSLGSWVLLARTVPGRWIIATGQNEVASRFTGIPVGRMKVALYGFMGFCAGLAAVVLVSRNNTAKADMAGGMELAAITAAVLGGANINGGSGSLAGVLMALALVHEANEFISWHWRSSEMNLIVMGVLLIGSVVLPSLLGRAGRRAS